jgi:uncharacterized protein (TIGR02118 family)
MHKFVVLYNAPEDPEHFRDHYVNTHIPIASQMPGMLGWRYSFAVASPGETEPPYFCVFEAEFEDGAALGAAMESEAGQKAAADVPNYATGGATILTYEIDAAG